MTKKKITIISFIIVFIFLAGISTFLIIKKKELFPKELSYSNLSNNKAVVSFFTDEPVKSCLVLSGLKFICQENPSNIHYFQLEKLKADKKYRLVIILNNMPFFHFLGKKTIDLKADESLASAENLTIETSWEKQKIPVLETLKTKEDNPPLIIKGRVSGEFADKAIVYFTDLFADQIISAKTNFQGNFIVDLQGLAPIETLRATARTNEKEFVATLMFDDLSGKELRLGL